VRIAFHKISDERHALEVEHDGGARERVECETRSYLMHDLLHYAVEAEAGLSGGFWGSLAAGRTLAQLNDRGGPPMAAGGPELEAIEQLVGALTGATKGRSAAEMVAGMRRFAESLGGSLPAWLTETFVEAVQERMRRLVGHWKATPFRGTMELPWPVKAAAGSKHEVTHERT
jgi:hypothetical protein